MPRPPWPHGPLLTLAVRQTYAGQTLVNVFAFEAVPPLPSGFTGWEDVVQTAWITAISTNPSPEAAFRNFRPGTWQIDRLVVQQVETPGVVGGRLIAHEYTAGYPLAGTWGGDNTVGPAADPADAIDLKWRTVVASKRTRGRSYLGGVYEGTSPGRVTGTSITRVNAFGDAMLRSVTSAGQPALKFVIYSRPFDLEQWKVRVINPTPPPAHKLALQQSVDYPGASTPIATYVVDTILRTQRRREIGVGV